jgi:protease IV
MEFCPMRLMREILNGIWMLHENDAASLFPLASKFLSGANIDFSAHVSKETAILFKSSTDNQNKKVLVIPIKSVITKYDYCGEMGMVSFVKMLNDAKNDASIGSVVLDMDTGGGEASHMPHVAKALRELNAMKPVLTYFSGYCASAGYYIASQTSKIYASDNNDIVGSIGTMVSMTLPNEKADYNWVRYYATKSTEKNRDFELMIEGKPENYIKNVLDPFNDAFHADVRIGRPQLSEEVFTGISMISAKSSAYNLIDGIKSYDEVLEEAFSLIK